MTKIGFAAILFAVACGKEVETADTTTDTTDTTVDTTPPTTPPTTFEANPEADLTDIDVVADLGGMSALGQYIHFALIQSTVNGIYDNTCPTIDYTDPADIVVTGGCTDVQGVEWTGTMHYLDGATGLTMVMSDGFGAVDLPFDCSYGVTGFRTQSLDGTVSLDYATYAFTLDVVGTETALDIATCTGEVVGDYALEYVGSIANGGSGTVFSGSGRFTSAALGRVDATTINQLSDSCATEADSGVTLLSTADHDVAIVYDGALACDSPGQSTWTLDGVSQGTILLGCSTAPSAGWLALLPLGLLARRRR